MEKSIQLKKSNINKVSFLALSCISILMLLQSCSIQLAPKYDVKIVDALTSSSDDALSLLAEVADGTKTEEYSKREEKYNELIGKMEALELQIKARPVPDSKVLNKIKQKVNDALTKRGNNKNVGDDDAPSAKAIENIVKNIKVLKGDDKTQNVSKAQIDAHKGFIVGFLDQALTYEKFLNPKI